MENIIVQFTSLIENCDNVFISSNGGRRSSRVRNNLFCFTEHADGITIEINADGYSSEEFYFNYETEDRDVKYDPDGNIISISICPEDGSKIEFINADYMC